MRKLFIAAIMLFSLNMGIQAQSVTRNGNSFTQVTNKKSAGKAFIFYINKKGEQKRRYMPEIGRLINPEAYKDKK